jgi:hypothetical protein
MAKTRPPYTPEFRRQMVELVRVGRSFEPTAQSIRNCVGQAECDAGRRGNAPANASRWSQYRGHGTVQRSDGTPTHRNSVPLSPTTVAAARF